ncbi:SDR family NAD(P)-dependent oxidoreductase [Methanoregula sp.]|uniref:SDR family NAD(P)-dependent oxidoreductase n=1 Tax=Methanoregula sp. TaxID=2052170 RepID=UPI0035621AEB
MKLTGRNAIITGANRGFGFEIAKKFVEEGASVAICGRDSGQVEHAVDALRKRSLPQQTIIGVPLDVSKEENVRSMIDTALDKMGRIDVVVNNAGVYGPKGLIEDVNSEEWVDAIHINLLSVFFMCKGILPHMKKNNSGKIINLSGGGATAPLPRISAYAASKAAVVRLTETLAEECREYAIDINAVAPGALNTRLLEEVLNAGPESVGKAFYEKALKQKASGGTPLHLGAELCVYLASPESNGITGKLISAPWDPWQNLAQYRDDLRNSDIYTLRRIVEKDRGKNWGT